MNHETVNGGSLLLHCVWIIKDFKKHTFTKHKYIFIGIYLYDLQKLASSFAKVNTFEHVSQHIRAENRSTTMKVDEYVIS